MRFPGHQQVLVAMIHNGLGKIVIPTFEIDIFQTGFTKLCQSIDEAIEQTKAALVPVGMEPTCHYFENLARHLDQRPQRVTLINSYAVSQNCKQRVAIRTELLYHDLILLCRRINRYS